MSHIRKTDTILITVAVKTIRKEEDPASLFSGASFGIFSTTFLLCTASVQNLQIQCNKVS